MSPNPFSPSPPRICSHPCRLSWDGLWISSVARVDDCGRVGADVVAAVHAKYLVPELFGPLEISDPPPSWRAAFDDVWSALPITTVVHGALRHYDWTDLRTALRD